MKWRTWAVSLLTIMTGSALDCDEPWTKWYSNRPVEDSRCCSSILHHQHSYQDVIQWWWWCINSVSHITQHWNTQQSFQHSLVTCSDAVGWMTAGAREHPASITSKGHSAGPARCWPNAWCTMFTCQVRFLSLNSTEGNRTTTAKCADPCIKEQRQIK